MADPFRNLEQTAALTALVLFAAFTTQANITEVNILVFFPMANSAINKGIDHANRKRSHPIMNAPPPFAAASRGNLHIFPVPTAAPIVVRINPNLEENSSGSSSAIFSFL
jgi:hypothetical protein